MTNEEKLQQEIKEQYEVIEDRDNQIDDLKRERDNLKSVIDKIFYLATNAY